MTSSEIEELDALMAFNDALAKPTAIAIQYWEGDRHLSYRRMSEAGYVRRYARPPRGFSRNRFFGVRITQAGRDLVASHHVKAE